MALGSQSLDEMSPGTTPYQQSVPKAHIIRALNVDARLPENLFKQRCTKITQNKQVNIIQILMSDNIAHIYVQ
jgi:hypothetical protein